MKIKEGFMKRKVGGTEIVVAVGEKASEFKAMISLNGSGSFLWDLLEKGTDEPSLVAAMLEKYDISEDIAKKDVHAFLEKARSVGLLDEA